MPYRGWTIKYDENIPGKHKWRGDRFEVITHAVTEEALKKQIDKRIAQYPWEGDESLPYPWCINVICRKNGANASHLTDGKVYKATHYRNALFSILDDKGYERFIIPNERCPHLVVDGAWGGNSSVGLFEVQKDFPAYCFACKKTDVKVLRNGRMFCPTARTCGNTNHLSLTVAGNVTPTAATRCVRETRRSSGP